MEAIIIFILLLLVIFLSSWRNIKYGVLTNFALSNKTIVLLPTDVFKEVWYPFLNMYFPYFQQLDEAGKDKFSSKLIKNLRSLEIFGRDDFEVNDEMRVLLCATLTQLTFGLKRQGLDGYKVIHVYPSSFYSKYEKGYVDAVTFNKNLISISWQRFEKGILNQTDGINLGLAEMGLALVHTIKNGESFDLHFASYYDKWVQIVEESEDIVSFLDYIGVSAEYTNKAELFAQAVVYFFEKPHEFKSKYATQYAHLCLLLNQNPVADEKNYSYERDAFKHKSLTYELPSKVSTSYQYHTWHWIYSFSIITPMALPFLASYYFMADHVINVTELVFILMAIGLLLTGILYQYNFKSKLFNNSFKLGGFCTLAVSPWLLAIGLMINDRIILTTYNESHPILNATVIFEGETRRSSGYASEVEFLFADQFLEDYPYARRANNMPGEMGAFKDAYISFELCKGIFGITYIRDKKIIQSKPNQINS